MEDWDVHFLCDLRINLVGCVGAKQDSLYSGSTKPHRGVYVQSGDCVPLIFCLEFVDSLLVQVVEEQRWVRVVTVCVVHGLIDVAVIFDGRVPRGSPDETKRLHFRGRRKLR